MSINPSSAPVMTRQLESAQFLIIARTPSFLDSRSPFIDPTAVAFQREQRKLETIQLRAEEQLLKDHEEAAKGNSNNNGKNNNNSNAVSGEQQQLQTGTSNNNINENNNNPNTRPQTLILRSHPQLAKKYGINPDEDDDGEPLEQEFDDEGNVLARKPTTQQLLSPSALLGDFCLVYGISGVCEHLLRLYENHVLAERSRRNLQNKLKKKQEQLELLQLRRKREEELHEVNSSGINDKNSCNNKKEKDDETENSVLDAEFEDPSNDLSTTYPLEGMPSHFQYDGGILIKFLDSLQMLAVFELVVGGVSSSDKNGLAKKNGGEASSLLDEPKYVPRGMLWIKSHLLNYLESRAKKIEVPK